MNNEANQKKKFVKNVKRAVKIRQLFIPFKGLFTTLNEIIFLKTSKDSDSSLGGAEDYYGELFSRI